MLLEPITLLGDLNRVLVGANVPYFIAGSFASSIRGEFRATNDVDVVAKFNTESLEKFVELASKDFFVDEQQADRAFQTKRSFNVIHIQLAFTVDLFTNLGDLEESELTRATNLDISNAGLQIPVATAEYTIVAKLRWYLKSNRILDSQLRDISGLLRTSSECLDFEYIRREAEVVGATDILNELLIEHKIQK